MRRGAARAGTAAVWSAAIASCAVRPGTPQPPQGWPFAPVAMRVYPLTHFDHLPDGSPAIICHLELTDAWGDTTKGVGRLLIQLFGPDDDGAVDRLHWEVDLTDLGLNAAYFDPATQTYRVPLTRLPPAVAADLAGDRSRGYVLRATLEPPGRSPLVDDFPLGH